MCLYLISVSSTTQALLASVACSLCQVLLFSACIIIVLFMAFVMLYICKYTDSVPLSPDCSHPLDNLIA